MTQTGKAVALISSFGAVGGVGAYAGGLFSNKEEKQEIKSKQLIATISSKLTDEGFLVLDTAKNDGWEDVLNAYKDDSNTKNLFSRSKTEIKTIKELKEECSKIINKEEGTNNNYYSLAKQWCVKKEKMNAVIERAKLKLLKIEADDSTDNEHWTKKLEELKKDTKKFKTIEQKISKSETATGEHIKALKEGCKNLKIDTLETISDEFAGNLSLAKEWCSIDK